MIRTGQVTLIVYGLFLIAGGVMGFVKADSTPSLIFGCGFGVAMLVEFYLSVQRRPLPAFFGAFGLTLLLLGRFVFAWWKSDWSAPHNAAGAMISAVAAVVFFLAALRARAVEKG